VKARVRDVVAVLSALAVYKARIVPQVRADLARWRGVAEAIPDSALRAQALEAIDEKALNVEATAVFATLAPRRTRTVATRAMVALQVAVDYIDTIGERGSPGDADYLDRLFGAYRDGVAALPSHRAVGVALERAIGRCGEGQAQTHAAEHGDRRGLEAWARSLGAPAAYRWWEVAAGASSSVAAHALIGTAADPRTTAAEAELIDAAYFPSIGALTVLLDDLIDREADATAGAHNYLAYYRDAGDVANRLDLIARLGGAAIDPLRHRRRHAAILAGVAGFYLSAAEAETPYARPSRDRLLRSAGPAVSPIVAVMRRRR
jgi:tetraprenyl-beta-curcumene synthase